MEKPVKMVVCDLDGTLLYSPSKITDRTKKAIRELKKKGILFGVCSGRSAVALKNMLSIWGIDQDVDFVLGFNGGMLWDPKTDAFESWNELEEKNLDEIFKAFENEKFAYAQYQGNTMLATADNPVTRRMAARNRLEFKKVSCKELHQKTLKFMAIGMPWQVSSFLKKHAHKHADWRMFRSGPFLIEVIHPALSKYKGIMELAKRYDIEADEIVTFGNDNNDIEMLEGCIGVAMGNALENVKAKAKYITASNLKDGVAQFIEKKILKEQ